MPVPPTIAPARPHELEAAFQLVFRHVADKERGDRITNAVRLVQQGELDPAGVLVASDGAGLAGVIVCLPVPGASGLLWPPQVLDGPERTGIEDALVGQASAWLRQQGAKLAQCMLSQAEMPLAEPLPRNGFAHVTALWYMQRDLESSVPLVAPRARLQYIPYSQLSTPRLFRETLMQSYAGGADCPEVTGVRTAEEVIDGHRAQGKYDPGRWWLALAAGQPVGVLLLNEVPEWAAWDVAYVGVLPRSRRLGFGRELMLKALAEARRNGVPRLTLSVDVRNHAAYQLYTDLGFQACERREIFLAIWR